MSMLLDFEDMSAVSFEKVSWRDSRTISTVMPSFLPWPALYALTTFAIASPSGPGHDTILMVPFPLPSPLPVPAEQPASNVADRITAPIAMMRFFSIVPPKWSIPIVKITLPLSGARVNVFHEGYVNVIIGPVQLPRAQPDRTQRGQWQLSACPSPTWLSPRGRSPCSATTLSRLLSLHDCCTHRHPLGPPRLRRSDNPGCMGGLRF